MNRPHRHARSRKAVTESLSTALRSAVDEKRDADARQLESGPGAWERPARELFILRVVGVHIAATG